MTVDDWYFRRDATGKPSDVAWIIIRVIQYRIRYYSAGPAQWTAERNAALVWEDREQAYAVRAKLGGLVLIVE